MNPTNPNDGVVPLGFRPAAALRQPWRPMGVTPDLDAQLDKAFGVSVSSIPRGRTSAEVVAYINSLPRYCMQNPVAEIPEVVDATSMNYLHWRTGLLLADGTEIVATAEDEGYPCGWVIRPAKPTIATDDRIVEFLDHLNASVRRISLDETDWASVVWVSYMEQQPEYLGTEYVYGEPTEFFLAGAVLVWCVDTLQWEHAADTRVSLAGVR